MSAGGVHDAGKIINPKTARSQAIGGIWGVGQAPLEQSETDPSLRAFYIRTIPVTSCPRTQISSIST
jgi:xanthine dehydrogenase YagR molybdenum-binding subunit